MIDTIRLSERARQQLITLKRYTSIQNWNILCRWAFCLSLREPSVPPDEEIPVDSSVEMSWRTFAGANEQVYWGRFHRTRETRQYRPFPRFPEPLLPSPFAPRNLLSCLWSD